MAKVANPGRNPDKTPAKAGKNVKKDEQPAFEAVGKAYRHSDNSIRLEIDGLPDHFVSLNKVAEVLNEEQDYTGVSVLNEETEEFDLAGYLALTKSGRGVLIKIGDTYYVASTGGFAGLVNGGRQKTRISKGRD